MCFKLASKPKVKEFNIRGPDYEELIQEQLIPGRAVDMLGMLDGIYYFTDAAGWAEILAHLAFKSDLYKLDKFDCEDYALKAMATVHELYGLNAFGFTLGETPGGYHGFNFAWDGEKFFFFEPNEGFGYGGAFPLGEHGYSIDEVLV